MSFRRVTRPWLIGATALAAVASTAAAALPSAGGHDARGVHARDAERAGCSVITTTPRYRGAVPSPRQVLGFDLGDHQTTNQQLNHYLRVVDRASDRVVSGTLVRTATGRPVNYALTSVAGNLAPARLARISAQVSALRDPGLAPARARAIAARMPAILWLSGSVHGDEPAAADANMQVLYDLADRSDCVARTIRENALVGVIYAQNPDGRAANTRTNSYAFDVNRDWFARTQPETAGKLDLLAKYPPQLYIDEHGMGGSGYFFPPNSDPIYHETPDRSVHWINDVYGAANAAAFTAEQLAFETYQAGYDLFYQGYGDTVPTTEFGAAGMTFEVGQEAPYRAQTHKHYLSATASLYAGASRRQAILRGWHRLYVQAAREGRHCRLQPNRVYNPGNTVQLQVPTRPVCGYFLRTDARAKARDLATVVRRLQLAGVRVRELTRPLHVADYTPYGRATRATTLPTGTYWIPMAQAQKHWVQAMLNEDTYTPFPYFYDVSGWSNPLLSNLRGGYTGTPLRPASRALPLQQVRATRLPEALPRVGMLDYTDDPSDPSQSAGWLRWRLERDWQVPMTVLHPAQVSASTLAGLDVLLVPDLDSTAVARQLGADGATALAEWTSAGGRYVGWQGGTELAATLGLSTAVLAEPTSQVPGSLFRVRAAANDPLTRGVGPTNWVMYVGDPVMRAADPADVVVSYPPADSPDWFVSGYQEGAEELGGTAVEVSEQVGTGDVTVFSVEPNFRAYTDGSAKLVLDAILASRGTVFAAQRSRPAAPPVGAPSRAAAERRAAAAAKAVAGQDRAELLVTVRPRAAERTADVLDSHGARYRTSSANGAVVFAVQLRSVEAGGDPAAWVRSLPVSLGRVGVTPRFVSVIP